MLAIYFVSGTLTVHYVLTGKDMISLLTAYHYSLDGIPVSPCFHGLKALYSLSNRDSHCELLTHESQTKAKLQVDNFS